MLPSCEVFEQVRVGENFANNLVKELFSVEQRLTSNVRGVLAKKKYNEKMMAYILELTFTLSLSLD